MIVPNDGEATVRVEVGFLKNDSVSVRVNGVEKVGAGGFSGASSGNPRYLRAGITGYNGSTTTDISAHHSDVGVTTKGWLYGRAAAAPTGTSGDVPLVTAAENGFSHDGSFPSCSTCTVETSEHEIVSEIAGAADSEDAAFGTLDFGGASGWTGRTFVRSNIGLGDGQTPTDSLVVLEVRDTNEAKMLEVSIDSDRKLGLYSPTGGLRSTDLGGSTDVVVPNDGESTVRLELSMLKNDSVVVRVNGVEKLSIGGLSGATTSAPRYLRAGIVGYNGSSTTDIGVHHRDVGITSAGWLYGRTTAAPTGGAGDVPLFSALSADGSFPACASCDVAFADKGSVQATVSGAADSEDQAYGTLDLGGPGGWTDRTFIRTNVGLGDGDTPTDNLHVLELRDVNDAKVFELSIDSDRELVLYSPTGGLRSTDYFESTGVQVPNDGSSTVRVEISALRDDGISVRVNGLPAFSASGFTGATTAAARYVRVGIAGYNGASTTDISVHHSEVGASTAGWLYGRTEDLPASGAGDLDVTNFSADGDFATCASCRFESQSATYEAEIASASDDEDSAYGTVDFGGADGWDEPTVVRTTVKLDESQDLDGDLTVMQVRDAQDRELYSIYADEDRNLWLSSPAGGLRTAAINEDLDAVLPNDGAMTTLEVSTTADDEVSVRVDLEVAATIGGLSGALTSYPRYLSAGLVSYGGSDAAPVLARYRRSGATTLGFRTGAIAFAPTWNGLGNLAATADFNEDGNLDLAIAPSAPTTGPSANIFLGNANGSFGGENRVDLDLTYAFGMVAGKFDSDNHADLAAVFSTDTFGLGFSLVPGNGDGNFDAADTNEPEGFPDSLTVADFNEDGKDDIVLQGGTVCVGPPPTPCDTTDSLVYLGGSNPLDIGSFPGPRTFATTTGDVDGDGHVDVVGLSLSGDVRTFLNDGTASFSAGPVISSVGTSPRRVVVGEFTGDSAPDLAVADADDDGSVWIAAGDGLGDFDTPVEHAIADPETLAVADFDRDGKDDLAVGSQQPSRVTVYRGNGSGGFGSPLSIGVTGNSAAEYPKDLQAKDVNGDGEADLIAVTNKRVVVLRNVTTEGPMPALLAKYAPNLRYDSDEQFFADSAATLTNNYVVGAYTNVLRDHSHPFFSLPLASSDPDEDGETLNLQFLGASYPSGPKLLADRTDQVDPADDDDYPDALVNDAHRLHLNSNYADRIYGRGVVTAAGIGLEYWLFYYDNPKTFGVTLPVLGYPFLRRFEGGDHEGDWEYVQVTLQPNGDPTSATYASHKGAARCEWGDIETDDLGRPVVYVAEGSHASYFGAGDWDATLELPGPVGFSGTDNADGASADSVVPTVLQLSESAPNWVNWPGRWGGSPGFEVPVAGTFGDSPDGPKFKGEKWSAPLSQDVEDCPVG